MSRALLGILHILHLMLTKMSQGKFYYFYFIKAGNKAPRTQAIFKSCTVNKQQSQVLVRFITLPCEIAAGAGCRKLLSSSTLS